MRGGVARLVLATIVVFCLGASRCYVSTSTYVGYGYTHSYYDDVFYTPLIDRYGYGFYGHP